MLLDIEARLAYCSSLSGKMKGETEINWKENRSRIFKGERYTYCNFLYQCRDLYANIRSVTDKYYSLINNFRITLPKKISTQLFLIHATGNEALHNKFFFDRRISDKGTIEISILADIAIGNRDRRVTLERELFFWLVKDTILLKSGGDFTHDVRFTRDVLYDFLQKKIKLNPQSISEYRKR